MKFKNKWLVIGSGFHGILAAYQLSKNKENSVDLIDSNRDFGGVLNSIKIDEIVLDKGCHIFDNQDDLVTDLIFEINDDQFNEIELNYSSYFNEHFSDGISVLDLSSKGRAFFEKAVTEMVRNGIDGHKNNEKSIEEYMKKNFGNHVTKIMKPMFRKVYGCNPGKVDPDWIHSTMFDRIKLGTNDENKFLKKHPFFGKLIASSHTQNSLVHYPTVQNRKFRHYYPKEGGLRSFCKNAEKKLKEKGVSIQLNQGIKELHNTKSNVSVKFGNQLEKNYDCIYWAIPPKEIIKYYKKDTINQNIIHKHSNIFSYYFVKKKSKIPTDFIHIYDKNLKPYRVSFLSNYGKKIGSDLYHVICVETPMKTNNLKKISIQEMRQIEIENFDCIKSLNLVNELNLVKVNSFKIYDCINVPLDNFQEEYNKVINIMPPNHIVPPSTLFTKNQIAKEVIKRTKTFI